ncbi:MAG: TIGR02281 family clan AA aspartic protease [Proteobacteria bacterium]|nr:TIGR02281 family clan AA aspartic protease [Pseudomonadota bacterium]
MKLGTALVVGIVLTLVTGLVVLLAGYYPGTLAGRDNRISLIWAGVVLVAAAGSVAVRLRSQRLAYVVRSVLVWGGLGLALVVGYSYWEEVAPVVRHVTGYLLPAEPRVIEPGLVALRADTGRHFRAVAEVNGQRVQFVVDTGASDVALTREDARRVGIDVDRLVYSVPYRTANGTGFGAAVRIDRIRLGDIALDDVAGHVAQGDMDQSLLGMSFLRRLSGMEIRGNEMILRR